MSSFLAYTVNGLVLGSTYALTAIGYSMVYGILELVNFTHSTIYMVGGLIIGLTEVYTAAYIGSNYRNIPAFIILILVLFLRPTGLFGAKQVKKV